MTLKKCENRGFLKLINSCFLEEKSTLRFQEVVLWVDWEIHLSHWNKVCLFHEGQRCALFCADHPSIAAQLLRFWLYFMSPNCDWPRPPVASFHLREEGSGPFCWLGHLGRSAWLSADLHLHRTVRDTSQVHPPLGWYGSQLTSTCPLGPASPFTPRPPASLWDYLTYPAQLLLQLFNKTLPLFTNTSKGKTLLSSLVDAVM